MKKKAVLPLLLGLALAAVFVYLAVTHPIASNFSWVGNPESGSVECHLYPASVFYRMHVYLFTCWLWPVVFLIAFVHAVRTDTERSTRRPLRLSRRDASLWAGAALAMITAAPYCIFYAGGTTTLLSALAFFHCFSAWVWPFVFVFQGVAALREVERDARRLASLWAGAALMMIVLPWFYRFFP